MSYEYAVVGRRGHMEDGEHVTDQVRVKAVDLTTGLAAHGVADTDEVATELATAALEQLLEEKAISDAVRAELAAEIKALEDKAKIIEARVRRERRR